MTTENSLRSRLQLQEVQQIYAARPPRSQDDQTFIPSTHLSRQLALQFNIGERSVREIWNRRKWREHPHAACETDAYPPGTVTRPLWSDQERIAEEITNSPLSASLDPSLAPARTRKPGRPRAVNRVVTSREVYQESRAEDTATMVLLESISSAWISSSIPAELGHQQHLAHVQASSENCEPEQDHHNQGFHNVASFEEASGMTQQQQGAGWAASEEEQLVRAFEIAPEDPFKRDWEL
eukprot:3173600-Rhodomonas_salina.1